jgi:hypothetical protein
MAQHEILVQENDFSAKLLALPMLGLYESESICKSRPLQGGYTCTPPRKTLCDQRKRSEPKAATKRARAKKSP